jgi:hypothetical protein
MITSSDTIQDQLTPWAIDTTLLVNITQRIRVNFHMVVSTCSSIRDAIETPLVITAAELAILR